MRYATNSAYKYVKISSFNQIYSQSYPYQFKSEVKTDFLSEYSIKILYNKFNTELEMMESNIKAWNKANEPQLGYLQGAASGGALGAFVGMHSGQDSLCEYLYLL